MKHTLTFPREDFVDSEWDPTEHIFTYDDQDNEYTLVLYDDDGKVACWGKKEVAQLRAFLSRFL